MIESPRRMSRRSDDAARIGHLHDRHVGFGRHVVPADGEVAHRVVPAIRLLGGVEVVIAGIAGRIAEEVAAARSALHVDAVDRKGRRPVREPCRTVVARDGDRHGAAGRLAVARDRDPVVEAELAAVVVRGLGVGDDRDDAVGGRRPGGVQGRCRTRRQDPRLTDEERQRHDRSQESPAPVLPSVHLSSWSFTPRRVTERAVGRSTHTLRGTGDVGIGRKAQTIRPIGGIDAGRSFTSTWGRSKNEVSPRCVGRIARVPDRLGRELPQRSFPGKLHNERYRGSVSARAEDPQAAAGPPRYGLLVALRAMPQRVTSQSASTTIRRESFE